jgi:DNA-binding transcriptional LysR family regulator
MVRLEELRSHSFVVGARTGGYTEMIQRLLERNGLFGFEVALRVGSFEAIKEAVRSGLGIGVPLNSWFNAKSEAEYLQRFRREKIFPQQILHLSNGPDIRQRQQ